VAHILDVAVEMAVLAALVLMAQVIIKLAAEVVALEDTLEAAEQVFAVAAVLDTLVLAAEVAEVEVIHLALAMEQVAEE